MCFVQRIGESSKEKDKNDQEPAKPFNEDKLKRMGMIHVLPQVNKARQFPLTARAGGVVEPLGAALQGADSRAVLHAGVSPRPIGTHR